MVPENSLFSAIDDARVRHAAVLDLIHSADRQGIGLLGLYTTLGIAAASGAVAAFGETQLPNELGFGLITATLLFGVGSLFCFRAMWTTKVYLPGREAEYWLWAEQAEIGIREVFTDYMNALKGAQEENDKANAASANAIWYAKLSGVVAPFAALATAIIAAWAGA